MLGSVDSTTIACAVTAFVGGWVAHSVLQHVQARSRANKAKEAENENDDDDDDEYEDDDEEDDDEEDDEQVAATSAETLPPYINSVGLMEDTKMVLVVRADLEMGKGKAAAQCCHAAIAALELATHHAPRVVRAWSRQAHAKVVLKTPDEASLFELQRKARQAGLVSYIVRDAGRTQIAAGSRTVLAVGPGPVATIDKVTGGLKLY
ncbi:hypothetical protein CAOG_00571 [Capsaspora owczarzaki ATCC 30864]|uniref:peptidyl-tRNA hydrolase n=1 Tax=Capsaspora owczarzaki (strain ATCC 30864) TaxID=595528 RepID=A0A0D2U1C5_CAPO3|nr:hypothetical protein CAOG_00571 [Capsaspora owczarzaki ATCC 30864]KJE89011.1 hypothetical protein, variant [Capsaspora owczarzaki ATCC 30864]|eukprot:XP_004365442.1 hypothetical protein CAOG_00571 [Capsaspora owczarzaki ATCC 30864]